MAVLGWMDGYQILNPPTTIKRDKRERERERKVMARITSNGAIASALENVHYYMEKIREMEASQDFTGSEPRYMAHNERLKEAREYHLKLTLGVPGVVVHLPSLSKDPFFSQVGIAT